MTHRYPRVAPTAFVVVLALGLIATACGGSTDKTSTTSPSTPAADASTTTPATQIARVMKSGLLRASDLPRTWKDSGKASASGSSASEIALAKKIPACRAFAATVARENEQTKVPSHTFVDATAPIATRGQVSNEVVDWPSIADAKTAYGVYSASPMKSCLKGLFRKLVLQQVSDSGVGATVSVEDLQVPTVGDAAIGYQAIVTLTGATTQQIAFVVEIVRVGNYTVSYNATMYKSAPADFGKNLVVRSVTRLEDAPSS